MYIVKCLDVKTGKEFEREFWDRKEYNNFINKCKYSKLIKILATIDNSKFYD